MARRKGSNTGIPGVSFSWKRALGISQQQAKFSRQLGVPLSKSGRRRKYGPMASGCLIPALIVTLLILTISLAFAQSCFAASFDKVAPMSDEDAKSFIINSAGKPVWLDKNAIASNESGFISMENIEHLLIGNVDIDNGIIEIIKDNGEKFYWKSSHISMYNQVFKQSTSVTVAMEMKWLFYFKNPYEVFSDWPDKAWFSIRKQIVYIGMNKEMAVLSWGDPDKVNKTTTAYGVREQWVYSMTRYLYFENGVLTGIQN